MRFNFPHAVPALLFTLVLAGCGSTPSQRLSYDPEEFDSTTTHTRTFGASQAQTCEAARRALLSQGYLVTAANADLVAGRKSFQPAREVHVEMELRVVCARDGRAGGGNAAVAAGGGSTIAFASALQDRYSLKKVNNSASVGVGAIGSVSLPFSSSDDALVKVASETLTDERFYDRLFALVERFLVVPEAAQTEPVPTPVPPPSLPPPSTEAPLRPVPLSPSRG
ncbi:DUF2242 domain-containing protein [Variovorax sp. KK3]|uniref:DUF2242 domain-containing protein n=1 Tax=Variovorax sp. KK3 TaxID=1855728 RepID=UPI00097BE768|nr:DUF2242 domain-containing protein [Variovorax sp. KK3]